MTTATTDEITRLEEEIAELRKKLDAARGADAMKDVGSYTFRTTDGEVTLDGDTLSAGRQTSRLVKGRHPRELPWREMGVDVVIEATGRFRKRADLEGHLEAGAGKVLLRAASPGTGIIAGGPMRAVFECLGVQDVVTKSVGSSNPYNMVRATFEALRNQSSPRMVAARRGKKVSDILGRRRGAGEAQAAAEA